MNPKEMMNGSSIKCDSSKTLESGTRYNPFEDHKFCDVPSGYPPVPEGYVPLGMGNTFKVAATDNKLDIIAVRFDNGVPYWDDTGWCGNSSRMFYATSVGSKTAALNYPWLAEKPVNSKGSVNSIEEALAMATKRGPKCEDVTILNHPKGQVSTKAISLANYGGAIPEHFTLDCKNFTFEQIQEMVKRNFVPAKPREWTDIPQPLAPRNDLVNHPTHYTSSPSGVECIQVTEWMGFLLGNAIKYIWRAGSKGNEKQDLQKAVWYIQRRIAQIEKGAK